MEKKNPNTFKMRHISRKEFAYIQDILELFPLIYEEKTKTKQNSAFLMILRILTPHIYKSAMHTEVRLLSHGIMGINDQSYS